ncbi:MAG: glycosyltransferase [Bacteroidetes bacterium]|nr:glycosyltransferase [Bacteroidota bacterium]
MILLVFSLGLAYLWIGLKLASALKKEDKPATTPPDGFSLIIPFRNEDKRLHLVLASLTEQKLPDCPVEVIFVDDGSTDQSVALITNTIIPGIPIRIIRSAGEGKPAALETGRQMARYSWLITTDADMRLPTGWLANLVSFTDDKTDLVCGVTLADRSGFAGSLQTLETTLLMAVAVGMHRHGHPLSATGNSMAFRASSIASAGGFESVEGSPREDHAIYQRLASLGFVIKYRLGPGSLAQTPAEPTLTTWLRQRRRWFGSPMGLTPFVLFSMSVFSLVWFLFVWGLLSGSGWMAMTAFLFKLTGDLLIVQAFGRQTGHRTPLPTLILFELIWVVPLFLLLVNRLINPVVVWKGRRYG